MGRPWPRPVYLSVARWRAYKILVDAEFEIPGPPSWSPNGRQIAFSAIEPGEDPDSDNTIYIVNADGSGLTELPSLGNDINPAWSPDGKWLAFHSSGNLAIMPPDGSDQAWVWYSEGRECAFEAQWSPDSQWIAVLMQMGGCEWTFSMTREVWVISRDGTTVTTVATITHEDSSCVRPDVAFSPDGTQVAYFDVDCKPWIINTDGSGLRQITSGDVNDIDPAWSPDGQWISFHITVLRGSSARMLQMDGGCWKGSADLKMIEEMPWLWLPNFWPPWGGEKLGPR